MRVLITGGTGFIGKRLIQKLDKNDFEVAFYTRILNNLVYNDCFVFSGDFKECSLEIIKFNPQIVFHLAGSSSYPSNSSESENLWKSNFDFGISLLEIVKGLKNIKFINFNTSLAYDGNNLHPYSYYSLTKATFLNPLKYYSEIYGFDVFNLILYNVYGDGDQTKRALNYIIDSLDSQEPILMSPGEQQLDFIHVDDVIALCLELIDKIPINGFENIHVGTGIGTTLKTAAALIKTLSNKYPNIQFGALPYRKEEKMNNVAPIDYNRFWMSKISFEKGVFSLLKK